MTPELEQAYERIRERVRKWDGAGRTVEANALEVALDIIAKVAREGEE